MPASPALGLAIVAEEIAAVPAGNPERAAAEAALMLADDRAVLTITMRST